MANLGEMMGETVRDMGGTALQFTVDRVENAETDGRTMFYNPSFFSNLEAAAGADGVRFVLAHELGHQVNGMEMGGHAGEFAADEFAVRALARAGAKFSAIASVFSFLGGDATESHPSSSARETRAYSVYKNARAELAEIEPVEQPSRSIGIDLDLAI